VRDDRIKSHFSSACRQLLLSPLKGGGGGCC
jgi:hypothetical protein